MPTGSSAGTGSRAPTSSPSSCTTTPRVPPSASARSRIPVRPLPGSGGSSYTLPTPITDRPTSDGQSPTSDDRTSNDRTSDDRGATRVYADGITRPYGDGTTPVRPALGSPTSPARRSPHPDDADTDALSDDARARSTASPVVAPTSADSHVNRVDAAGRTTSVPTRIASAPAEPADANETSEAAYTQPISASELRRRAADDDE